MKNNQVNLRDTNGKKINEDKSINKLIRKQKWQTCQQLILTEKNNLNHLGEKEKMPLKHKNIRQEKKLIIDDIKEFYDNTLLFHPTPC